MPHYRQLGALALLLGVVACADPITVNEADPTLTLKQGQPMLLDAESLTGRQLVIFGQGSGLPADVAARIEQMGGTEELTDDALGFAAVSGLTPAPVSQLRGMKSVSYV